MTAKREIESIFNLTNHELYVVTASHAGVENGMLASWVLPGTLAAGHTRAVVLLSVSNLTTELIRESGRFTLQMLAEGQHELVPHFGLHSGRELAKLDGLELERTASGLPLLTGTCGWADCVHLDGIDGGDRAITLVEVVEQRVVEGRKPLSMMAALSRLEPETVAALLEKRRRDGLRDAKLLKDFGAA